VRVLAHRKSCLPDRVITPWAGALVIAAVILWWCEPHDPEEGYGRLSPSLFSWPARSTSVVRRPPGRAGGVLISARGFGYCQHSWAALLRLRSSERPPTGGPRLGYYGGALVAMVGGSRSPAVRASGVGAQGGGGCGRSYAFRQAMLTHSDG